MNNALKFLFSTALGAAAMYYFDPARGRYRRALVRDQLVHAGHKTNHGASVVARDTRNRVVGVGAGLRSLFDRGHPDDAVLVQRVRSDLGRVVTHPHSIKVEANDGVITLSGPILEDEVPLLLDCALGVPGVRDLQNRLEVHAEPRDVPGLQGTPRQRPSHRFTFMQENWSPAALLLLTRAVTNLATRRLIGVGVQRHTVDVQKGIRIHAPVENVFALWDNFENFPKFMRHVRHVTQVQTAEGRERWRWTITGPTGTEFEFDSAVIGREENRLLAWRTVGSAFIQHAGRVRFQDNGDGSTTVDIKMMYNPVAGIGGGCRSDGKIAICVGCASPSVNTDSVLHQAARWLSLISPRYSSCRCTCRPWVRRFSTTLQ